MKPARFTYHRAHSVDDALLMLEDLGDDAKVIAGGQSLMAMMSFRLARPTALIDLGGIEDLSYMGQSQRSLKIGALTTHHQVERAGSELSGYEVLKDSMKLVGHLPIRTRGTVGGSLAHADATAEWCILAVLLDAVIVVHGRNNGRREIPAADFFFGLYTTALAPDELIVEIVFPRPAPNAALVEYAERAGDFAIVSAAVRLDVSGDHTTGGRLVLGGIGSTPLVVDCPALTSGQHPTNTLATACAEAASRAVHDHAADSGEFAGGELDFRAALARTMTHRAVEKALGKKEACAS